MARDIIRRTPRMEIPDLRRRELVEAFLASRKPTTIRAYESDLKDFAICCGHLSPQMAAECLFNLFAGEANHVVLTYRAELVDRQLAVATVARRIGKLRWMSKVARLTGLCSWSVEVEAYRDVTGPGEEGFRAMLAVALTAAQLGSKRQLRNLALVRVLHDLGLRRAEVSGLDQADVEWSEDGTPAGLWIRGKGRDNQERVTDPQPTAVVLRDWLVARGERSRCLVPPARSGQRSNPRTEPPD